MSKTTPGITKRKIRTKGTVIINVLSSPLAEYKGKGVLIVSYLMEAQMEESCAHF